MGRPVIQEPKKIFVMPSSVQFCKLNFHKLYAKARRLGIVEWNDALDYPDFIHGLWHIMLTHEALKEDAMKIDNVLKNGDSIELLSEIVLSQRRLESI